MARIRIVVTGNNGQIVRSLVERSAGTNNEVVCIGRPALDLSAPDPIDRAIGAAEPDVLLSDDA